MPKNTVELSPNDKTELVSVRRVICLGLVAGFLNAVGFVDLRGLYPAAMTGNTTQLGILLVRQEWLRFGLVAATVSSFFAGAIISSYLQHHMRRPAIELLLMACLAAVVQAIRVTLTDGLPWELPLLATCLAMQGETISRFGGRSIQTIVVTNTLIKFADGVVRCFLPRNGEQNAPPIDVILPGSAWFSYVIGAIAGVSSTMLFTYAIVPPILLLLFTAVDLHLHDRISPSAVGETKG